MVITAEIERGEYGPDREIGCIDVRILGVV